MSVSFENRLKLFKRASARHGLSFALWLIRLLPYRMIRDFMHFFVFLWSHLALKLRRVAHESLTIAFGREMGPGERRRIVRDCFDNIGRSMVDLIYYSEYPERVGERFVMEGREHLERAVAEGRGVIVVTAHFGNFCLMMMQLAQLGYKTNCIIRKTRDSDVAGTISEKMTKAGVRPIYSVPARRSVQESLKALRDNEILCILLDQHYGSEGGVLVDFFGRKAATATGPVVLARRTQAPVLPVFTIREGERYRVIIEPPLALTQHGTDEESVVADVAAITRVIERYIRKYPAEWGWMHRRWKKQPVSVA